MNKGKLNMIVVFLQTDEISGFALRVVVKDDVESAVAIVLGDMTLN